MRYFLDNCICPKYAPMLAALGVDIVALKEKLPANTPDVDIFSFLKGQDYVFLSEDRRQLTRIAEASALRASGITAIYFGPFWHKLQFWEQATYLVRHWSDWEKALKVISKGSIFEAKHGGKLMSMP